MSTPKRLPRVLGEKVLEYQYPVVEKFFSLQGEGLYAGVPMAFVRLAGCPVGGPTGLCKSWQGKEFVCDTGPSYQRAFVPAWAADLSPQSRQVEYHAYTEKGEKHTAKQLWEWVGDVAPKGRATMCLTGGEPLVYELSHLLLGKPSFLYHLHIETSGTVEKLIPSWVWLTVSPKAGALEVMLKRADEVKLLVERTTEVQDLLPWLSYRNLCLQPIDNQIDLSGGTENMLRAVELCKLTGARLSLQTHKLLRVR